ncbi:ras association domain-containing protein 1 [Tetranychus urticae]|uniref:ras association domain-containing protein 1 n=1 Tax=Tetranychus urticae TaxID=32264 RepID=UPI00077BE638|nr:ras association domain-containing protein 1 [Tetranychus urticae]
MSTGNSTGIGDSNSDVKEDKLEKSPSLGSNQSFGRQSVIGNLNNWINDLSSGALFQGLSFLNFRRRGSRGSTSSSSTLSPFFARSASYSANTSGSAPTDNVIDGRKQEVRLGWSSEEEVDGFMGKTSAKFLNGTLIPTLKTKEIIELDNFGVVEVENLELGVGHKFELYELKAPTWCDSCSQFIWTPVVYDSKNTSIRIVSPFSKTIQCTNCKYTCHIRCRSLVRIDCKGNAESPATDISPVSTPDETKSNICDDPKIEETEQSNKESPTKEMQEETVCPIKDEPASEEPCKPETESNDSESLEDQAKLVQELSQKIIEYNERLKKLGSGLGLTLLDGKSFRGFLRVHLNLTRPINVVAGTRPPSIYDIINEEEQVCRRTLTSFYMPRNTVKNIHITSEYTSLDVIKAMLKKFKVVDNPQKFALYRRYPDERGESVLKRIGDNDYPLRIALDWCDWQERQVVLQENDTADIVWDAFLLPELNNFLIMLDREEQEHLSQLRLKYDCLRSELNRYIQLQEIQEQGILV